MSTIQLKQVTKEYRMGKVTVSALRGVDLAIEAGEMICIMGPSGCGKSTLLNLIGVVDRPTSGTVTLLDKDVERTSDQELSKLRNHNLGFIFQHFNLIPVLDAFENVEYPLLLRGLDRATRTQKVERILDLVGMLPHRHHRPDELSGGQQQRVAIARALVTEPRLVLADEPTASLDSKTGEAILTLMQSLNRSLQTTFVFSTHDLQVQSYARRMIRLHDGLVVEDTIRGENP